MNYIEGNAYFEIKTINFLFKNEINYKAPVEKS